MGPDTSAYHSCSATLNGELFVFGGLGGQEKQVIFLKNLRMKQAYETLHFRSVKLSTAN